ncbi:Histone-lysine N-methyltransferase SETMAR [Portunus trituberculatus]|uniref:Histone-lysine N-methyltransferase SETMAR n=1 Tax=Portunus trituberculatus TaxID=210409 RepID=A0A5B7I476_PORTR|nr:Histone-lysine N-methyltransferase SETMAR [Portunus trituberculatus]
MTLGGLDRGVLGGCECPSVCQTDCHGSKIAYRENILTSVPPSDPVLECNDLCACVRSCGNRVVQHGPVRGLEVRSTPGKGMGLFTSCVLPKGAFVCEYAGEIISTKIAVTRFERQSGTPNYILAMTEHLGTDHRTTIVDPTVTGNIGRYANHSCEPNMCVLPVRIGETWPRAALFTKRQVQAGEELCYHYGDTMGEPGRVGESVGGAGRVGESVGEAGRGLGVLGEAGSVSKSDEEGERVSGREKEGDREAGRDLGVLGEAGRVREAMGEAGRGRDIMGEAGREGEGLGEPGMYWERLGESEKGMEDTGRGIDEEGEVDRRWEREGEREREVEEKVEEKCRLSSTPCLCGGKMCLRFLPAVKPEMD